VVRFFSSIQAIAASGGAAIVNGRPKTTKANRVMEDGQRAIGDEGMKEKKRQRGDGDSESSV